MKTGLMCVKYEVRQPWNACVCVYKGPFSESLCRLSYPGPHVTECRIFVWYASELRSVCGGGFPAVSLVEIKV